MEKILQAKPVIKSIYEQLRQKMSKLNFSPNLTLIMVGSDPSAEFYVNNIVKKCNKIDINVRLMKYESMEHQALIKLIGDLNKDPDTHALMIQKPLPKNFDEKEIVNFVNPIKDVDAFNPENLGKLIIEEDFLKPCTPSAVIELLKYYKIKTEGKNVVIVGRSNIVGKPLANMLLAKNEYANATVTVCHSKTADISFHTKNADILIAAVGQENFITSNMIKENSIIIDVGVNLNKEGKYVGDVDFEGCLNKVKAITPVPGGIGSITTAVLLQNIIKAAEYQYINLQRT